MKQPKLRRRKPGSMFRIFGRLVILFPLFVGPNTAHADGRIELLMFESAACKWCDLWRKEIGPVYAKSEEGRIAPLRPVSIRAPRPGELKGITGVVFTPTFVLWDGKREFGRILGYGGEIQFWGLLEALIKQLESRTPAPAETFAAGRRSLRATPVGQSSGNKK